MVASIEAIEAWMKKTNSRAPPVRDRWHTDHQLAGGHVARGSLGSDLLVSDPTHCIPAPQAWVKSFQISKKKASDMMANIRSAFAVARPLPCHTGWKLVLNPFYNRCWPALIGWPGTWVDDLPVVLPPCQNPRLGIIPPMSSRSRFKRLWAPTGDGLGDAWASRTQRYWGRGRESRNKLLTASSLLTFARSHPSSRRRTNRRPLDEEPQVGEPTIKLRPRMPGARRVHTAPPTLKIEIDNIPRSVENRERPSHCLPCITPGIAFWLNSERVLARPNPLIS